MAKHKLTHQLLLSMFVFNTVLLQYDILINTGAYRVMGIAHGMPGMWRFRCACLPNPVRLVIAAIISVRALSAIEDDQSLPAASGYSELHTSVASTEQATASERVQDVRKPCPSGDTQATPPPSASLQPEPGGRGPPRKRLRRRPVPKGDKFMPNVSLGEIMARRKSEKHGKARETLLMCVHRKKGCIIDDIVDKTCTSKSTVSDRLWRMHKEGLEGCYDRPKSGRPRKIDPNLEKPMKKAITCKETQNRAPVPSRRNSKSTHKPGVPGTDSGVWTAGRVSDILESGFGITGISHSSIYRMLHRLRLSNRLMGRPVHPNAPSKRKKTGYKKGLARRVIKWTVRGYSVLYLDESYLNTKPNSGRTWCPIGSKAEQPLPARGKRITLYGALGDGISYIKQYDAGNTDNTILFLKYLHKTVGKVVLITDNASYHKSTKLRGYLYGTNREVKMEYIPPYSPDLNRIEWLWREIKRHKANMWFDGVDDVVKWVNCAIYDGTIPLPPLPDYVLGGIRANKKHAVQNIVSRAAIPDRRPSVCVAI